MDILNLSLGGLMRPPVRPGVGPETTLVLLHGYGSNELDLMGLAPYLDPRLRVVSVRAPLTMGMGSYAWFELNFHETGLTHDSGEAIAALRRVAGFLDELTEHLHSSPDRVILGGFSQGAALAAAVSLTEPEKVAATVALSGLLFPEAPALEAPPERLTHPFFVAHGTLDPVVPVQEGRRLRDHLEALGVRHEYHEYLMAHQISDEVLGDLSVWLATRLGTAA
jgi:phospholipase/carboxylesterase